MTGKDYPLNHASGIHEGLSRILAVFRLYGPGARNDSRQDAESTVESAVKPSNRCECGGYNEAFVMQHWANYDPLR